MKFNLHLSECDEVHDILSNLISEKKFDHENKRNRDDNMWLQIFIKVCEKLQ